MPRDKRQSEPAPNQPPAPTSAKPRSPGLFDAPPKTTFFLGLFVGIAVTAVTFLIVGVPGADSSAEVKGTAERANANTAAVQPTEPTADPTKIAQPSKSDHYRGAAPDKAKYVLVEYSDFQCPYCSRLNPTLQRLVEENQDDVSWVYRHFPLTSIHTQAVSAALASECASDQNKFWEYSDKLYENQSSLGEELYKRLAKELGLNETKFNDCYTSKKYEQKVTNQMNEGDAAGITGTPATFVLKENDLASGELVSGAMPYESFQAIINSQ